MPEKLKIPDHVQSLPFLTALAPAQGFDLGKILQLYAQYKPIIDMLLALLASKNGGQLPAPAPEPTPTKPPVDIDTPDQPGHTPREIVGAEGKYFHIMEGDPSKVKPVDRARFLAIVGGDDPINGDLKTRIVLDITPLCFDGSKVLTGDPENRDVKVKYGVEWDGIEYWGDEITDTPVVVNNMDANFGLTPRLVLGPGIAGKHTVKPLIEVNGFPVPGFNTLRVS